MSMTRLHYLGFWGLVKAIKNYFVVSLCQKIKCCRWIKRRIYDYRMWLDVRDPGISRTLLLFGQRELDHKFFLETVLKPGMTVLDIGANLGYYAIMAARLVGLQGQVIAIEPSPDNLDLLKRNVHLNALDSVVTIKSGAVSSGSGHRLFYLSTASNLNTFHKNNVSESHLTGDSLVVKTYTVLEIQKAFKSIDLIRMDVEGHEVEILEGMLPSIELGILSPMILFETHNSQYNNDEHDMEAILNALFNLGYRVLLLSSNAEKGTKKINTMGYQPYSIVKTDFVYRGLYRDIDPKDAIDLICCSGARTVLLKKQD